MKEVMQELDLPTSIAAAPEIKEITEQKQKILVLEDNQVIQEVVGEMCLMIGLEVHMATEGSEAFDQYRQRFEAGTPFDVVLLDLNIPRGMGGLETAQNILAIDPDAKLIVCSGNSGDPVMRAYEEHGFMMSLCKPYSFSDFKSIFSNIVLEN